MLARPDILRSSAHGGVICTEFTCMLGSRTVEYGQTMPFSPREKLHPIDLNVVQRLFSLAWGA